MKFIQLAVNSETIVALDEDGRVWTYHKAIEDHGPTRFAFWSKLTDHRSDPAKRHTTEVTT